MNTPMKKFPLPHPGLGLRREWRTLLALLAGAGLVAPGLAAAAASTTVPSTTLPMSGVVASGSASIAQSGAQMTVTQTTPTAIINWGSFSIGSAARVTFAQTGASASVLNRVAGSNPSSLFGTLSANGRVWLINPAGIMVGNGAMINVAGFVASSLAVSDSDFLANRLTFGGNAGAGAVSNDGSITTPQGGSVYLIGPTVDNSGTITAPGGEILLGAGQSVQLVATGTPGVRIEITGTGGVLTNLGNLVSSAGQIGLAAGLIHTSGTVDATSLVSQGGRIFLRGPVTLDSGTLDAGPGGSIDAASNTISVLGTSTINSPLTAGTLDVGTSSLTLGASGVVDVFTLAGGTYTGNASLSAGSASVTDGFMQGPGKFSATNFSWSGGTIIGVPGDAAYDVKNLTLGGSTGLDGRTLNLLAGGISSTGVAASLLMDHGAVLQNAGTLTLLDGSYLGYAGSLSTPSQINNTGTLISATPTSPGAINLLGSIPAFDPTLASVNFNNTGTVNVSSGALHIGGNGTHAGAFNVSASGAGANTLLRFGAGFSDGPGTQVLGAGAAINTTSNNGGAARVEFADSVVLNANVVLDNIGFSRGVLSGSGKLSATNFSWSGGTLLGAPGAPAYDVTNLALEGGNLLLDGRRLNLLAGGTSSASNAALTLRHNAELNNAGTFNLAGINTFGYGGTSDGSSRIVNTGTINVAALYFADAPHVGQTTYIGESFTDNGRSGTTSFVNAGTVNVANTTLEVSTASSPMGTYNILASGSGETARLRFGAGFDHSGAGYNYNAPTQTLGSAVQINALNSAGGSSTLEFGGNVRLDANVTVPAVAMTYGVLQGSGKLAATNFAWSGGTIRGTGSDLAYDFTNVALSGATTLDARRLNQTAGGSTVLSGALTLANGAVVATNGSTLINPNGASVSGTGTLDTGTGTSFINNGTTSVGNGALGGTLTVTGDFAQGDAGTLGFTIAGGATATHGLLDVRGNVALAGTLSASSQGGYVPAPGDSLPLITRGGGVSGAFGAVQAPAGLMAGYGLYTGEAVRLVYVNNGATFFSNAGGDYRWHNAANWSGAVLPGSDAAVVFDSGLTILHDSGNDSVRTLQVNQSNSLRVSGGTLGVSGLTTLGGTLDISGTGSVQLGGGVIGSGLLSMSGGSLDVTGSTSLDKAMLSAGRFTGSGALTVASAFRQDGGSLNFGTNAVSLTQASGELQVGAITAGALNLVATQGAIREAAGSTASLRAATLTTSSSGGTQLDASANQIGAFTATNSGSGAIVLVNTSAPGSLVLNTISNPVGDISIDNTGAILTAGAITAGNGTLKLMAHSPITVNSALSSSGAVTLTGFSSGAGSDNVAVNASVQSSGAGINVTAGTNVTIGSGASLRVAAGSALNLTAQSGVVTIDPGADLHGATVVIHQSVMPAPVLPAPVVSVTTAPADLFRLTTPLTGRLGDNLMAMIGSGGSSRGSLLLASNQTIGGTSDSFGGDASGDGASGDKQGSGGDAAGKGAGAKGQSRPLPVCN